MNDLQTEADVLASLRSACAGKGGQRAFARATGVAESTVSEVLNGHEEVPTRIANLLGFAETRGFRKIAKGYVHA